MNATLRFGTELLIRAEVVRIVGRRTDGGVEFRQKPIDRKRFSHYDFDAGIDDWPGIAVPAELAPPPPVWQLEPSLNGHAVLRCRRIPFAAPIVGLWVGRARLAEGTIMDNDAPAPRNGTLEDRRWIEFHEVALPPGGHGRARIALVLPYDASEIPRS